jgi:hypothetical protein
MTGFVRYAVRLRACARRAPDRLSSALSVLSGMMNKKKRIASGSRGALGSFC